MKLTIFGATGATGQCLVEQALDQGHDVTAARLAGMIDSVLRGLDILASLDSVPSAPGISLMR